MTSTKPGTSKNCPEVFRQTHRKYDGTFADQDTSHTMDTNSENNNPNSPSTAVRNMICVITRTSKALTVTDTEIPVYQQSFPSIS